MVRKITKYFSFLLLLIAGILLAYPLWNTWLINTYLPSGVILKEIDSDYPGFEQIFVNKLLLDVDGIDVAVNNLQFKYDLSLIELETITLQLSKPQEEESESSPSFNLENLKLPELNFEIFNFLEKLQSVKIKHLTFFEQKNTYQFSDFSFDDKKVKKLNVKLEKISNHFENDSLLNLFLSLNLKAKKIGVRLVQNKDVLLSFDYHKKKKQTALTLQANFRRLRLLFPNLFSSIPIETREFTTLNLVENNEDNTSKLELETTLLAQKATTKLEQELAIPINITATSNLNKNLNANINIKANILNNFSFMGEQNKLSFEPIVVDLDTQISQIDSANDSFDFQIKNTTLNLSSSRLDFHSNNSELSIEHYKLNSILQDLTINLNSLNQAEWRINSNLVAEKLTTQHNQNTTVESKIAIDIKLDKSDKWRANGKLQLAELEINNPSFALNGLLSIDFKEILSDFNNGEISINLDTHTNRLTDMDFDSLNLESKLSLNKESIKGSGNLLINEQNLTPFSVQFDKESLDFSLDLQKKLLANQIFNHFLNKIGKQNKLPLEILEGKSIHSGKFVLADKSQINSQLKIEEMLFQFGENEIQGLSVEHKLTSIDPLQFESDINIEKIDFSSGLSVDNLSAKINSQSTDNILVKNVHAQLLEGELLAHELKFFSSGLEESVIQLEKISLTELIFFMDVEGLYGEGQLNLSLPLSMKAGSPAVKNGTFVSEAEGIIKYSNGEPDPQEEENIALQALRNFHYRSLDGTISYNRNGKYHIKLHLVGSNPDLYDGYPIDFVLHLRGELTGVFRSLFLTGNFEDAVMQQVKTGQLKERKSKPPLKQDRE